jgi:hypothetical protein
LNIAISFFYSIYVVFFVFWPMVLTGKEDALSPSNKR